MIGSQPKVVEDFAVASKILRRLFSLNDAESINQYKELDIQQYIKDWSRTICSQFNGHKTRHSCQGVPHKHCTHVSPVQNGLGFLWYLNLIAISRAI